MSSSVPQVVKVAEMREVKDSMGESTEPASTEHKVDRKPREGRRLCSFRLRKPNPAPMRTWVLSFGALSGIGFVGSSFTFSTIFTAPSDRASRVQIILMCWAFSCYVTAFAAAASVQIFLTMVTPTAGEGPSRSKYAWVLNVMLYFSIALLTTGTFLLGVAVMGKVKGAGLVAVVLPSAIVPLTVIAAAYANHVEDEPSEFRVGLEEGMNEMGSQKES